MDVYKYPVPVWMTPKNWKLTLRDRSWWIKTIVRDSYKCADCGRGDIALIIHHIDETRKTGCLNNDLLNLITLCRHCHSKRHGQLSYGNKIDEKLIQFTTITNGVVPRGLYTDIAIAMGISRERVRQRASKLGLKIVKECNECKNCHKSFKGYRNQVYCSVECRKETFMKKYYDKVNCEVCGKDIFYYKVNKDRVPRFCSHKCQGKMAAQNYGWQLKSPSDPFKLKEQLGDIFTKKEFNIVFKYSYIGGSGTITRLIDKGIVSIVGKKGKENIYKINT